MYLNRHPLCECGCRRRPSMVHHKDRNPRNNHHTNLMALTDHCHKVLHAKEGDRWKEKIDGLESKLSERINRQDEENAKGVEKPCRKCDDVRRWFLESPITDDQAEGVWVAQRVDEGSEEEEEEEQGCKVL